PISEPSVPPSRVDLPLPERENGDVINGKSSFPWTRRELLIRAAFVPALRAASSESKAVNVLSVPRGGIQPQIAVCEDVVHMIYFAGDPKQGDVFYTRSNDFGGK